MGLFSRNTTASPGRDLNGSRPNFKAMTISAMTVIDSEGSEIPRRVTGV